MHDWDLALFSGCADNTRCMMHSNPLSCFIPTVHVGTFVEDDVDSLVLENFYK